ncbi:MAG: hypothetical protein EAZ55_09410 [Cytophagales bacterium]|nr:MAG: hypothetical protein EAZ55_09410 [Cytophagales bacterium]
MTKMPLPPMGTDRLNVYEYCRLMDGEHVVLGFKGVVSQDVLSDVGLSIRNRYEKQEYETGKRVFSIFVELAQNIYHHSAEREFSPQKQRSEGLGVLLIQDFEHYFLVTSGNIAEKNTAHNISQKCQYINSLDEENLKQFYKDERKKAPENAGGNIGLIDIVRKSGNPLTYSITELNEAQSFLCLQAKVNKKN